MMKSYFAKTLVKRALFLTLMVGLFPMAAAGSEVKLDESPLPDDQAARLRGAESVLGICNACHGLKYIKYRDLLTLGMDSAKVDGWRGAQPLDSALQPQMPPEAARASFNVVPPDLSLMASAREGGGHYLYSYLTGYHNDEKGELKNSVFPVTRMPDILGIASATDAQQRAEISAKAKDIASFLVWAADPHADERRNLGYYVLAYVILMTILVYMWKKRIWRDIDRQPKIH